MNFKVAKQSVPYFFSFSFLPEFFLQLRLDGLDDGRPVEDQGRVDLDQGGPGQNFLVRVPTRGNAADSNYGDLA